MPYIQKLAERALAAKRGAMLRRLLSLALVACVALAAGCQPRPEGALKIVVIGGEPKLADPAAGPVPASDAVLLQNIAQGLVQFDASGNIVSGLAERWNVSDDGLSYIFRIASASWPDGTKITAQQVARLLKRQLGRRSNNGLKDALGAVEDVVAMTDRVIEIRLIAPRPNLLPLLAQPEFALIRNGQGTGPFSAVRTGAAGGEMRLSSEVVSAEDEVTRREEVLLSGAAADQAIRAFVQDKSDLVLGGTFADLPYARAVRLPRNSLRFDPAGGLFGLLPTKADGPLANREVRQLLSQAIDRDALIAALNVPGLAARATVLESGLDGVLAPVQPAWFGAPLQDRRPALLAAAQRVSSAKSRPTIRLFLPDGPGSNILLNRLASDWGAVGFDVERVRTAGEADLRLIDEVAPSSSAAWYLRRFHCGSAVLCDSEVDKLLDAARTTPVPAQRYALLSDAGGKIDDDQLFIPLAAPVRWSLVGERIQGFAGNRYARHTLTDLQQKPSREGG
jgi:peptide/nickel transport system substrate-binding protein